MKIRRLVRIGLACLLFACLLGLFPIISIYRFAAPYEYTDISSIPAKRVAIVFGAGVKPDHTLSPMLADRVDGAIALYRVGKIKHLLLTGDNSTSHHDEPTAMRAYALAHGVPASAITLDYAGFDTHDSCYRARTIFGVAEAALVTQSYHQPRALYLCRGLGIDAVGYSLPDFSKYPTKRIIYTTREYVADIKAWWQLRVTHATPKFLGRPELIQ
jgi:vancomycin permeability regulator SanA